MPSLRGTSGVCSRNLASASTRLEFASNRARDNHTKLLNIRLKLEFEDKSDMQQ